MKSQEREIGRKVNRGDREWMRVQGRGGRPDSAGNVWPYAGPQGRLARHASRGSQIIGQEELTRRAGGATLARMSIHALWCHPRSVSTAFERIMRERGDLEVFHEPFMYHYYLTRTARRFPDFEPAPDHPTTYEDIRSMILRHADRSPVFFKDMAYYVERELPQDQAFAARMTHAFLVRDPAQSIVSYYRRDADFLCEELGIEGQHTLYRALCDAGHEPLVMTADQLREAPEATLARYWSHVGLPFASHAFGWDETVPEGWKSVAGWHGDVMNSTAIRKAATTRDHAAEVAALGAKNPEGYDIVNSLRIRLGQGVTGKVAATGEPIIIEDLSRELRAMKGSTIELLQLRYQAGLTLDAIARRVGLSAGAVDGRLRRASGSLREKMTEDEA